MCVGGDLNLKKKSMSTITGVSVHYSVGTEACTPDGTNIISIEFTQEFGDLPELMFETSNFDGIGAGIAIASNGNVLDGVVSYQGTKEDLPCAGRGECNHRDGFCECYDGFYSSNGNGQVCFMLFLVKQKVIFCIKIYPNLKEKKERKKANKTITLILFDLFIYFYIDP